MCAKRGPFEYKRNRDEDLIRAYRLCLSEHYTDRRDLILRLSRAQASRFWVSEDNALFIVRRLIRGTDISKFAKTAVRMEMYQEIYRRTLELISDKNLSVADAVTVVVSSPAPSFYLTPKSISVIIHQILKKRRNERHLKSLIKKKNGGRS